MSPHDIITKLIGPIGAVGESNADAERYKNLEATIDLVDKLLGDILTASHAADRYEASMKKIGQRAQKFLMDIGEYAP